MKNPKLTLLAAMIGLIFPLTAMAQALNTLSPKEKAEGWELLFDGKSMDKWRCYKLDKVQGWAIEDGAMVALGLPGGQGGDVITKEKYKDFELYLEWKVAQGSNSGIFFHVVEGEDYPTVYMTGPEYQLIDDVGAEGTDPKYLSGANYDVHRPKHGQVKTLDQWNTAKIVVKGAHVEHWLNDRKVVEYEMWTPEWYELKKNSKWRDADGYGKYPEGHIALQDHGGVTSFRNIKIRKL
ncbi:MAG: DUF1080 domain-containing protein [Bacteroidales bacterium]|jgi:hypothetical protein|nr:DUF1080 domain-containing protein [Bacteroidales bacterium]MDD2570477.1 DUF1080 domain-containing protein [Bacteroidales bacterium]MDD3384253.1 DUF1080 domain-containing protein [Bacteroidales bacterium]MDD3811319.1 DUF1080 domain-containing protein [Bacteroidales bacterium]MDD3871430.1 DUF1080 domain-containing protein [Bacteroidales bacterium]